MTDDTKKTGSRIGDSIFAGLRDFVGEEAAPGSIALSDGRTLQVVPMAQLQADPDQVRNLGTLAELREAAAVGDVAAARELERLTEMAASIREVGLQEPLGVEALPEEGMFRIVHGHRRHLALQLAEAREAPCVVWAQLPQSLRVRLQLVENLEREDLGEAEIFEAMERYKKALAEERRVPDDQVPWGEVSATFGMSDDNRKRIARLQRLAPAAYAVAKRARLSEWVLRPLLQYLQSAAEEESLTVLDEEAQQRIVLALAAEESPVATMTVTLLREELGATPEQEIPTGRSEIGWRFEQRWTGFGKVVARLRDQWGELTDQDQEHLREQVILLHEELSTMRQDLGG